MVEWFPLAAAMLFAQGSPPPWERDWKALPAGWSLIGQTTTGSVWMVHDKTARADRGTTSAWVKIDHSGDKTEAARTSQGLLFIVCEARRYWWESLEAT